MCGIVGVLWYGGGHADPDLVARQTHALRHRGPDDSGVWSEGPVALGQRRLSIVDLSAAGHQPMPNEAGSAFVTFNGEIYNWFEIRDRLAARGHRFRGRNDTEILLHLWDERGAALVEELRGMFAFGLYDRRQRLLVLARDRAGEKPLYYHDDGHRLVFASELKALLVDPSVPREVDPRAIADMLTFQYVPGPQTIYQGVRKLPAGHRLLCDAQGPRLERYWSLPMVPDPSLSGREAVERLRALLLEAVRIRLRADVPLGALLSGGVDSSAVVALMAQTSAARVRTFSIGFEGEDVSELTHARTVANHFGTEHHELIVRPKALELLPALVWGLDEPFSDDSILPTYQLAALARTHVSVALSGDGGDEAFAGYTSYPRAQRQARGDFVPMALRSQAARSAALLPPNHPLGHRLRRLGLGTADRHLQAMSRFAPDQLAALLTPGLRSALRDHDPCASFRVLHAQAAQTLRPIPALAALDTQTYLVDDVLFKVDRMSMLNSLEVRAPLLDHLVLEEAARLPYHFKIRGRVTKWALREAVRPWLPASILNRGKQGFSVPLERWFDRGLERLAREVLLDGRCRRRGWLDPTAVERVLAGVGLQRGQRAPQVFTMLCLELWAQTWLDRPREALIDPMDGPHELHPATAFSAARAESI